jgi:RimJ/RimL family protein N-acetyltransferase
MYPHTEKNQTVPAISGAIAGYYSTMGKVKIPALHVRCAMRRGGRWYLFFRVLVRGHPGQGGRHNAPHTKKRSGKTVKTPLRFRTERLDLVPATMEILESDLHDHTMLARLLGAKIPDAWPPYEMNEELLTEFIRMASENTDPFFSSWYWVLDTADMGGRILIGSGGIASAFNAPDTVLIGYAVLDEYQGQGYATEAVRYLIPGIFADRRIERIMATTYPELGASIRVLEKNGFICTGTTLPGQGLEEGTIGYVLEKQR